MRIMYLYKGAHAHTLEQAIRPSHSHHTHTAHYPPIEPFPRNTYPSNIYSGVSPPQYQVFFCAYNTSRLTYSTHSLFNISNLKIISAELDRTTVSFSSSIVSEGLETPEPKPQEIGHHHLITNLIQFGWHRI